MSDCRSATGADALVVTGPHFHQESLGEQVVTTDAGLQDRLAALLSHTGARAYDGTGVNLIQTQQINTYRLDAGDSVNTSYVFANTVHTQDAQVGGLAADTILQSHADGIVAAGYPPSAIPKLHAAINRVTVVPSAGQGVFLPSAQPGMSCVVLNHAALPCQIWGQGSDTVQDRLSFAGMPQLPGAGVVYVCVTAGAWYGIGLGQGLAPFSAAYDGGQVTGWLPTVAATGGQTAHAGGGQAGAYELRCVINAVSVVASDGDSVALMAASPGLQITVINNDKHVLAVFPKAGDAINGQAANAPLLVAAGKASLFSCPFAGQWWALVSA